MPFALGDSKQRYPTHRLIALGYTLRREGSGRAKALYEKALEKLPSYAEAKRALQRVLSQDTSLGGRYETLIKPAARWLACEIHRREAE